MNRWSTFKYSRNRDWSYFCEAYCENNYLCLLERSRIVISSTIGCDINFIKNKISTNFDNFQGYITF